MAEKISNGVRFNVKIQAGAKESQISEEENGILKIKVNAPAKGGRANARLIEILSEHFNVSKSRIRIIKGHISKNKIIEIIHN